MRQAINDARAGTRSAEPRMVALPIFGSVDPSRLSFPLFTVLIGLADGINPCAFYVLIVLLGLLLHVLSCTEQSYFAFTTAWLGVFLMKHVAMTERRAKILKPVSGTLLLVFGLLFLAAPQIRR